MVNSARGQSLMEVALVLPVLLLGIFVGLQVMWYCHNLIELQRLALIGSTKIAWETMRAQRINSWALPTPLQGNSSRPMDSLSYEAIRLRPFGGIATVHDDGRLYAIHTASRLFPGGGTIGLLPTVSQAADSRRFLDTPVPKDR